ncbi:MAG: polysaccharide deacetylase family protein [Gemmatimonadota bacterium]
MERARASTTSALVVAAVLAASPLEAQTRRMALTFDDLPAQAARQETAVFDSITDGILAHLSARNAPAVGFVNEGKLDRNGGPDPARVAVLRRWLQAGHELGNHTRTHPDLHTTPVEVWLADLEAGEPVTRALAAEAGMPFRYFRHPMLHTGRTPEIKARVAERLDALGYEVAPVTIDNQEWIFARAWDNAMEDREPALAGRIADAYVSYMDSIVGYYEQQSRAIVGYELPQVLLLHANRLNAHVLDRLLTALVARGYTFVELEEALADPAYARGDGYLGPAGITWLHRWALADGQRGAFFAGEPEVPAFVQEAFER